MGEGEEVALTRRRSQFDIYFNWLFGLGIQEQDLAHELTPHLQVIEELSEASLTRERSLLRRKSGSEKGWEL